MIRIIEDLQKQYESDEIDNRIFTPGSDEEKDYEQSQLTKHKPLSKEEEIFYIKQSIKNGPYNIKLYNNLLNNNNQVKEFNLVGIRGFINTQINNNHQDNLNNMIIIDGNKQYTITKFNELLKQYNIPELNI